MSNPLLASEDIAVIRDLCRRCLKVASKPTAVEHIHVLSAVVIAVATELYGQRDLYH